MGIPARAASLTMVSICALVSGDKIRRMHIDHAAIGVIGAERLWRRNGKRAPTTFRGPVEVRGHSRMIAQLG